MVLVPLWESFISGYGEGFMGEFGDRGGFSFNLGFAASPLGLLLEQRLREKLILINHLGRQSQFGT